jgi:hypothetical protein
VIANIFGSGVSTLLDQHNITQIIVDRGTMVRESIRNALSKVQK